MKKLMSVLFVLAAALYMGTTVFAAGKIEGSGGSANTDVKATYSSGGTATIIYSVDVTWGSMDFTYNDASPGTWNPVTHQYDGAGTATWTCAADANKITVTNHSNTAVTAILSFAAGTGYSGISGSFSKSTIHLATAVGLLPESAPADSSLLTLSGALASSVTTSTPIGSVTVTLGEIG